MHLFCNWCGEILSLNESSGYSCEECLNASVKICKRCHKPYPNLCYFSNADDIYCNSCKVCISRQKLQRKKNKMLESVINEHLLSKEKLNISSNLKGKKRKIECIEHKDFIVTHENMGIKKCILNLQKSEKLNPRQTEKDGKLKCRNSTVQRDTDFSTSPTEESA